jgi:hypothetical protein
MSEKEERWEKYGIWESAGHRGGGARCNSLYCLSLFRVRILLQFHFGMQHSGSVKITGNLFWQSKLTSVPTATVPISPSVYGQLSFHREVGEFSFCVTGLPDWQI